MEQPFLRRVDPAVKAVKAVKCSIGSPAYVPLIRDVDNPRSGLRCFALAYPLRTHSGGVQGPACTWYVPFVR
jgi:hypothetical protein